MPRVENKEEVEEYIKETAKKSDMDRTELNKGKTGCLVKGIEAINPVNGKKVPVYLGDFVLGNYGTGAVMAVPTHDQRDFEYAKVHNIEMIQVIDGADVSEKAFEKQDYLGKGCKLINSEEFTGLTVEEAKEAEQLGASYLTAGHIYATDCKRGLPPRGLGFLKEVCREVSIPVYGIGGIKFDEEQWNDMKKCGAVGGCVMSGMMEI